MKARFDPRRVPVRVTLNIVLTPIIAPLIAVTNVETRVGEAAFLFSINFSFVCLACYLTLFAAVIKWREKTVNKFSQRKILYVIIFGAIVAEVGIILHVFQFAPYDSFNSLRNQRFPGACFFHIFVFFTGVFIIMAGVIAKSYRINR